MLEGIHYRPFTHISLSCIVYYYIRSLKPLIINGSYVYALECSEVYDFGKDHGLNWLHPSDKDRKQPGRSICSVVLPKLDSASMDQAEALLEDAREFLGSESWYTERGIPYRRGYLLYGVPGGGKSSLIMAVASELRLPIYVMSFSSERMSDEVLSSLLRRESK